MIKEGKKVGTLQVKYKNKVVKTADITIDRDVQKANLWDLFKRNMSLVVRGK